MGVRSVLALGVSLMITGSVLASEPAVETDLTEDFLQVLNGNGTQRMDALERIRDLGDVSAVPGLIQTTRFLRGPQLELAMETLTELTGEAAAYNWHTWMLWQQANPQIEPFEGFEEFKARVYRQIDPNFGLFLYRDVAHDIRIEEIAWGGVIKDGIPALTNPELIPADEADYVRDSELVFGVSINGDVRAYPLRIMDWHEMFNDVIGGVPVSLAYCTLCGSGILFETTVEGRDTPFVFGSSGFLYRSNKLMYDTETHSLWNQFTGEPVVGTLTGSGIELNTRPVVITTWEEWREKHPDTQVLSLDTGYARDYTPGRPYGRYFASPNLMFPALVEDQALEPKDYVFALRSSGTEKAWRLTDFRDGQVINDRAGVLDIVLIGDTSIRTVRAYRADERDFDKGEDLSTLLSEGETWTVTEEALVGPDGTELARLPGHIAYWFAWSGYLGEDGELASAEQN